MNLYVMRHGTTIWNEKDICQGWSQNMLSKQGIMLVEESAKNLKDTQIDIIISSPLRRTIQTANIVNKYHNVKIIKDKRLIEINQGIFTGRARASLSEEELKIKNARTKETGMEKYEECYKRVKLFLSELKTKYNFENVLIVTHDCCASFIEAILNNKKIDFSNQKFLNFKNAAVKKFFI